jgi:hypothetical protein
LIKRRRLYHPGTPPITSPLTLRFQLPVIDSLPDSESG